MDLLVAQLSQGCLADLSHPCSSCCLVGTNHSTCEHSHGCLLVSPLSSPLLSPVLYPSCLLGPLEVSEIPNFQSSFSICWDFYNGSWPGEVQHLPHTDIGPFPVLGISVFCWSNSDSNFKMFNAAMSWQDSTSFPMPWLMRGG